MATKKSSRKKSSDAAARERQIQLNRDERLQRDQNLSFDSDAKAKARQREDAMANAQRGMNAQEAERIKEGDYVKVDLEAVPENVRSLNIARYKQLHSVGAHGLTGRVIGEEHLAEGRHFRVDSATHTVLVPEHAVIRADKIHRSSKKAKKSKSASAKKSKSARSARSRRQSANA
jgi:cold shock CspA family protein